MVKKSVTDTNVIWSDEGKFNLFRSNSMVLVWRKAGEKLKYECIVPTVKHGECCGIAFRPMESEI